MFYFILSAYVVKSEGKQGDVGCLPFTKSFRKIWSESNWNTTFRVVSEDNFWQTGRLKRWSCFPGGKVPNGNSCSTSSKSPLTPFSDFRGRISVNAIPGRNLPVLIFAYHLSKPRADRLAHVNGKQPLFLFILP